MSFHNDTIKLQKTQDKVIHIDSDDQSLNGSVVAGCLTATGLGEKSIEF